VDSSEPVHTLVSIVLGLSGLGFNIYRLRMATKEASRQREALKQLEEHILDRIRVRQPDSRLGCFFEVSCTRT
jgi:hypothetical protein